MRRVDGQSPSGGQRDLGRLRVLVANEQPQRLEVLARIEGRPVVVRQGHVLLCAFHPELTDDSRMHALLMAMATAAARERTAHAPGMRSE